MSDKENAWYETCMAKCKKYMSTATLARFEKAKSVTVSTDIDDTIQKIPKNSGCLFQFEVGELIGKGHGADVNYSKIMQIIKVYVWNLWGSSNPNEPITRYDLVTQNAEGERDRQRCLDYYPLDNELRGAKKAKEEADERLSKVESAKLALEGHTLTCWHCGSTAVIKLLDGWTCNNCFQHGPTGVAATQAEGCSRNLPIGDPALHIEGK